MRAFVLTWITAGILVFVLVDQNTYILRSDGSKTLKDRGGIAERIFGSCIIGGVYSACNSALVFAFARFGGRMQDKRKTEEKP